MRNKSRALIGLLAFAACAALAADIVWTPNVLNVSPTASSNGTNAFTVQNKAGTYRFTIEPTNAAIKLVTQGTNSYTAISTNLPFLAVTGVTNTIKVVNGIIVGVQ